MAATERRQHDAACHCGVVRFRFRLIDGFDTVTVDGNPVPGVAPAAKQQGAYVAKVIRKRLAGWPATGPFVYRHLGNLATIGRSAAVIDFGRVRLTGWAAWWIWGIAHIYFLIGTRSRLAVAISWLWSFLSGGHSARLITQRETLRAEEQYVLHEPFRPAPARAWPGRSDSA